ncbi:unnamed protein product [Urochloa humidicola]
MEAQAQDRAEEGETARQQQHAGTWGAAAGMAMGAIPMRPEPRAGARAGSSAAKLDPRSRRQPDAALDPAAAKWRQLAASSPRRSPGCGCRVPRSPISRLPSSAPSGRRVSRWGVGVECRGGRPSARLLGAAAFAYLLFVSVKLAGLGTSAGPAAAAAVSRLAAVGAGAGELLWRRVEVGLPGRVQLPPRRCTGTAESPGRSSGGRRRRRLAWGGGGGGVSSGTSRSWSVRWPRRGRWEQSGSGWPDRCVARGGDGGACGREGEEPSH